MQQAPKAVRPHIGIFGRRNTGKSSLLNLLLGYELAVVSPVPGTTTDPVEKSVEIPPLGPVVLIDTAGLDDEGSLGQLRMQKSAEALGSVDLALLVSDGVWGKYEQELAAFFRDKKIPFLAVWSKDDEIKPAAESIAELKAQEVSQLSVSIRRPESMRELAAEIARLLPEEALAPPPMLRDLVPAGKVCIQVCPIDDSAPKARLIAPQVQAIRDLLDGHALSLVIQPGELAGAVKSLSEPPALVVTDSQAIVECVRDTPPEVPLTTYSILMARMKADLPSLAAGAAVINQLKDGDRICISEVCTHHAQPDDIGRVKLPAWLKKFTGKKLNIDFAAGRDFPSSLSEYKLVIHCGGCMVNRPAMLSRVAASLSQGTPVTNYGVAICLLQGVLPRVLEVFPAALAAYEKALNSGSE